MESSLEKKSQISPENQEEAKLELQFETNELEEIFQDEEFNPKKLILLLKRQYPGICEHEAGVKEGYTLEEHTLMVMKQFEKYFSDKALPAGIDRNKFRLVLALHDIGKPEAIEKGGKHLQHEYTRQYVQKLFDALGIDKEFTDSILVLISGDPIGKFLRKKMNIFEMREAIEKMADKAKMPVKDFFELLCIYFKLDAGSYTENAGGLESLDNLFNFDEKNHNLNFAPHVQARIDQLGFSKDIPHDSKGATPIDIIYFICYDFYSSKFEKGKGERMLDILKGMMKEMIDDDELFDLIAKAMRKSYDALIKAGFTDEQAITIVAGQGTGIKAS